MVEERGQNEERLDGAKDWGASGAKKLVGWKEICRATILCREHLIKHGYPVYGGKGGVWAYEEELLAHKEECNAR